MGIHLQLVCGGSRHMPGDSGGPLWRNKKVGSNVRAPTSVVRGECAGFNQPGIYKVTKIYTDIQIK